ncbi:hypothetical protein LTR36_007739 [Oleoguttula mirabilis]|uniref:WLM domain-containing protein n=1 Tax=Oleoguttula mirabilis TaxID=1507867 RepID=A0AAV9JUP0_9PEZI|nr:hypothetical protein LTR36_007739 [Oleoguttula mirabilis]
MPLGFQRLNERTQRPNPNINFIKPLDGPDSDVAKDFLERIAAQCYPIMKEHYLSVMSLQEHAPNPEFLGRNFNAGEIIELVLKDKSGRWLSFQFVQMVMMHELAHCKQMNHSRFFWNVRNGYAKQMEDLWAKKYVGEGMWGRGKNLASGGFVHDHMPENAQIPEHLCGGTYRRAKGKKRKRGQDDDVEKPKVSYAERQQKRIAKKFGKHGEGSALGDDELVRGALDSKSGKRHTGKPKVAKSKRGRDLRANAALARFESAKRHTTPERTPELDNDDDGSETESDWSSDDDIDSSEAIILRRKGGQMKDSDGHNLVKVCGDEGEEVQGGQDEMDELRILSGKPTNFPEKAPTKRDAIGATSRSEKDPWPVDVADDSETESEADETSTKASNRAKQASGGGKAAKDEPTIVGAMSAEVPALPDDDTDNPTAHAPEPSNPAAEPVPNTTSGPLPTTCPICTVENEPNGVTCVACSHVLKPSLMKEHWRCKGEACKGSLYINAGDVGRCGLCGAQKPAATAGRPMGVVSADILRWD